MAKVALLVGVSEYEPGLNPLPAAVNDVEAMRELLLDETVGGFAEPDVTVLKNPERQEMEEAIEFLFAGRNKDDLLMFFFSGHGIKDDTGRLYLATRGTRKTPQGELIRSTAVSSNILHDSMSRSRSKRQVIILDSCFSGAFAEGMSAKDDGTVDIRTQLGGEGRAVLTSSSSTQYSFEYEGSELSLYTRFLVDGIKTGAADQDEDEVISIDELHDYASKKVREIKPDAKPEIFAIREGFKIRLAKVPPGDPIQKYRKEVMRYIKRGEISLVGRRTLDWKRTELGLGVSEAKAIEDQVLEPYRQKFREKLRQYEQAFADLLQHHDTISDEDRNDLLHLQSELELRNEDTLPIEAKVTAQINARQQKLHDYEQVFAQALRQEYPLSQSKRDELQQIRIQLELAEADVAAIETRITNQAEVYHQNLQQYQQSFAAAIQEQYPLSDSKRHKLRQQQQNLGLRDIDIAPIEAQLTTEIENYQQKLEKYEQEFVKATQCRYQPSDTVRKQLQQTWQTLALREVDVQVIEARIIAQINLYQTNLRQYEQEFTDATEQQYPLSESKLHDLHRLQQSLNLDDEDVVAIKNRIVTNIEENLKKLQQYEQVFSESIQYEYPLTGETRDELKRFQKILGLSDETVTRIEERVLSSDKIALNSASDSPSVDQINMDLTSQAPENNVTQLEQPAEEQANPPTTESDTWKVQYLKNLQQYEQEVIQVVSSGTRLDNSYVRDQLKLLQSRLNLTDTDVEQIELQVFARRRSKNSQSLTTSPPPVQPQYRRDSVPLDSPLAGTTETSASKPHDSDSTPSQYPELLSSRSKIGRIIQRNFWLMWTLAYTFGCGIGWSLSNLIFSGINTGNISVNLVRGALVGFILGGTQWLLLSHFSYRIKFGLKLWVLLTSTGYAVGCAIGTSLSINLHSAGIPIALIGGMYGITNGVATGLAQWFALKSVNRKAEWWILSVALSETLSSTIVWGLFVDSFPELRIFSGGTVGMLIGLMTGWVMLRLLRFGRA